ncbi:unnamed protein product [Cercospora beticola]|nr:unnamed protein product [Cercospora beticola]
MGSPGSFGFCAMELAHFWPLLSGLGDSLGDAALPQPRVESGDPTASVLIAGSPFRPHLGTLRSSFGARTKLKESLLTALANLSIFSIPRTIEELKPGITIGRNSSLCVEKRMHFLIANLP